MKNVKVGIIGASGYAGAELLRLLLSHPRVEVSAICSQSYQGEPIYELYPSFYQVFDLVFEEEATVIAKSDIIFASLPHGLSEGIARTCFDANKIFIDLGADFRLEEQDYRDWYHLQYQDQQLHEHAVYGLPELFREDIKGARIIGNPGCYPTSIGLALAPVLLAGIVDTKHLVIDAKSGVTGSGKSLSEKAHFPRCNESFAAYKVAQHRHTPEIEQTLSRLAKEKVQVSFTPHLLPINRGILSTIYIDVQADVNVQQIHDIIAEFYVNERFVRVLPLGKEADLKYVIYSNYCDISVHFDERNKRLILISVIDNMVKGAAGQAIQNMNLICSFDEQMGLTMIAPSF